MAVTNRKRSSEAASFRSAEPARNPAPWCFSATCTASHDTGNAKKIKQIHSGQERAFRGWGARAPRWYEALLWWITGRAAGAYRVGFHARPGTTAAGRRTPR